MDGSLRAASPTSPDDFFNDGGTHQSGGIVVITPDTQDDLAKRSVTIKEKYEAQTVERLTSRKRQSVNNIQEE